MYFIWYTYTLIVKLITQFSLTHHLSPENNAQLPRSSGFLVLVSATISLLPYFFSDVIKATPPEVFSEIVHGIFKREWLRFASLKLSLVYIFGNMCAYGIQG